MYGNRDAIGMLKGLAATVPLSLIVVYIIVHLDNGGQGTLVLMWASTVALVMLGLFLGLRCNGRKLTVAAVIGCAIFCIVAGVFVYEASQPIAMPLPYP